MAASPPALKPLLPLARGPVQEQQELPLELFADEKLTPEQAQASYADRVEAIVAPMSEAAPVLPAQAANDEQPLDLEAKVERAEGVLMQVLRMGHPICVSWSAGKDSSTVLNLLMVAAAKLGAAGEQVPPIVVTHGDTGIENPVLSCANC